MVLQCLADGKCWSPSNNTIGLFWSSYHILQQKKALFCTSALVHYCCPPTKHAPASGSVDFLPHLPATLFLYRSSLQLLDTGHCAHTFGSSTSRLESAVWPLLYHPILVKCPSCAPVEYLERIFWPVNVYLSPPGTVSSSIFLSIIFLVLKRLPDIWKMLNIYLHSIK